MRFKTFLLEYDTKKIDSFLKAIARESTPDPSGTKNSFWYKGVFFIIRPQRYSQSVHLEEIKSPTMGQGKGTVALAWFLHNADKFGIPVTLHPVQLYKDDGPTKDELINWYKKHGFKSDPGTEIMRREPKKDVKESREWNIGDLHTGAEFYFKNPVTVSITHPPAIYDAKAGSRAVIAHTEDAHVYFDLRVPGIHGDYEAYCPIAYFLQNIITKKEWDRQWMNSLKENIADDLIKNRRWVTRPLMIDRKSRQMWGKTVPGDKVALDSGDVVIKLADNLMALTSHGGGTFEVTPEIADAFVTKREWDKKWMQSLGEAKHPLDLQIAKEMAMDHITEKGYTPWNADLWHEESPEAGQHEDGEPYTYGEYYYGDNIDAFARDSESIYRNYKILDVHIAEDKPMFFNPKTEEFLIPVGFLFVDEEKIMKSGDHGMSTLDRDSHGRYGHSDDEHEMNVVTYIKVDLNNDHTQQILDINDEIPQWNRTPEYKKLKRMADLHDDPNFMKDRFDKLEKKFKTQSDRWVKITDQDKLEEAAHPLDFSIACETAREFIIDHGHDVDPEDIEFHGGFPEKFDDWIIDNVHVDVHRRLTGNPRHAEEQPAYYNETLNAYIIPVTFDFKPSDPDEVRGWYDVEATEWIMVTADGQAKKVNRWAYINRNAIHDMLDMDDPQYAQIKKRLGAWEEVYGDD